MTPEKRAAFQDLIRSEGQKHFRGMPWRDDPNPYYVYVSEIMLQQTQVSRVLEAFPRFLERFPGLESLAAAEFPQVLAVWSGLGYNRRARYLHEGARLIQRQWGGVLSPDPLVLQTLPGVGINTAGSIAAFAYDAAVVFIETNIRRVFIHHFFPDAEDVHDRQVLPLIQETLPNDRCRQWYWALMDYGTHLARTQTNPNRRSSHHSRQKPFIGSLRQIRGAILKTLASEGMIAAEQVSEYGGFPEDRITTAVDALEREGFLLRDHAGNITLKR